MKDSWSLADPTKLCHHACARCMHSSSQCHKLIYFEQDLQAHWIHSWKQAKWLKSFIKVHLCDFSATTSHLQPLSFISWMCALVPFRSVWGVFISFQFFSYLKRHLTSCLGLRWGRSNLLRFTPQQELFLWTSKCLLSLHQRQTRMPLCYHHRPCTQKPGEKAWHRISECARIYSQTIYERSINSQFLRYKQWH